MAKKKFILFQDQIKDFCRKDPKATSLVGRDIILVEAEVSEEDGSMTAYGWMT